MYLTFNDVAEYEPHKFVAEASTVGLRPGTWPREIQTDLGNKQPLLLARVDESQDGVEGVRYKQQFGCVEVLIIND